MYHTHIHEQIYNQIAVNGVVTEASYQNWITGVAIAADPGVQKLCVQSRV